MAKYHLTDGEKKNIQFRRMVMDYIADAINNEMGRYIYTEVRPRLGIKEDVQVSLSEDGEWLEEVEEEAPIIKDIKEVKKNGSNKS